MTLDSWNRVDKRTLHEQVADHLRHRLLTGVASPGELLPEARIATELGVSRGTVRGGFYQLQSEGLVEWAPRLPPRVRSVSRSEVEQLYAVRALLEGHAVQLIVGQDKEQRSQSIDALRTAAKRETQSKTLLLEDRILTDLGAHEALLHASGNGILYAAWCPLRAKIILALMSASKNQILATKADDHSGIIDAIEAGDSTLALARLRKHLSRAATACAVPITSTMAGEAS